MPNLEAGDIVKAVSAFRNSQEFNALRRRWDTDYDNFILKPYDAGKRYYSYTSNAPRLLATKCLNILTEAKLLIRYPDDTLTMDEREIANNNERLCYGVLNFNDEWLLKQSLPTLRNILAWHAIIRGQVAINPYVYKNLKGKTRAEVRIYDMYNTAYAVGKEGLPWVASTRTATREEIKKEYGVITNEKVTTVTDWWDTEFNAVLIGKSMWGKEPEAHGLDYTPVYILKAGATPPVERFTSTNTTQDEGESIFASNRNLYPVINKTMSDRLTIIRRGVMVPLGVWSSGGQKTLDTDIWQVEDGSVIPLDSDRDEKILPLLTPTTPPDTDAALAFVMGEEQRGGLSHVAQGDVGFRLSGFAINQIQASIATIITPFVELVERAYNVVCREMLYQYNAKPWEPIEIRGRTSKGQPFGMPKAVVIKPSDINPEWFPEVELIPVFPKDDAQRVELARMVTQGDRPLLSTRTAREEILGIDDVDYEDEKVSAEWSDNIPVMRLLKAFRAALADKDFVRAQTIAAEVEKVMGASAQMGQQMGAQPQATGFSPEVMPPEAMGGIPAGAAGATGAEGA